MRGSDHVLYKWGAGVGAELPSIESAHDEFLVTGDGREIIDAASGAVVVNLGHSLEGVERVMEKQAGDVSFVMTSSFTAPPLETLGERVASKTPDGLETSFFVSSGSQAVETALKLARDYHRKRGNAERSTVISRWQSYHGATLGALSASGNTYRRARYKPLLREWPHISPAYPYRWDYSGSPEEQARAAAGELEDVIKQEGEETVAAFIAEPVSGSSIPAAFPHPVYFEEIRRICDKYDVLFIADEVMTGFGRTGEMFAIDHFGVVPDMLVIGKGLSSGYAPISGVVIHDKIADHFHSSEEDGFQHGFTYAGNPLSAAVAAHVLEHYTEQIVEQGRKLGDLLYQELEPLREHPIVGDIRQIGLMAGIEFVVDQDTKEPFDPNMDVNGRLYSEALERGVYTFRGRGSVDGTAGDHLMLAPPLITGESSIRTIAEVLQSSIESVHLEIS